MNLNSARILEKLTVDLPRKLRDRAALKGALPEPVSPIDGGRGRLPTEGLAGGEPWGGASEVGRRVLAEVSALRWPNCPETGAVLPTLHRAALKAEPGAWAAARRAHQHRWFSTLARVYAETGDVACAVAAGEALSEWLAWDRPQVGVPYLHPSDAAVRLAHWALGAGWLGEELDADLWRRMAGSGAAQARFLSDHLSLRSDESDHRLITQAAGLVIAGLLWPEVEGARGYWSQGLALLSHHLPNQAQAGGVPKDLSPSLWARTLTMVLVARAVCRVNNVAFPAAAEGALAQGAWFLRTAVGNMAQLPPIGQVVEPLLEPWGVSPGLIPWNAVAPSLREEPGSPDAPHDRTALALAGAAAAAGEPFGQDKEWVIFALREGGLVLLHSAVKRNPTRVVFHSGYGRGLASHPDLFQILWDVGGVEILADPGGAEPASSGAPLHGGLRYKGASAAGPCDYVETELQRARVDGGREATVIATHRGFAELIHRRDLRIQGYRLQITDQLEGAVDGEVEIRWPLGPDWTVAELSGAEIALKARDLNLAIKLDSEMSWTVDTGEVTREGRQLPAPVLVGRAQAKSPSGVKYRASFEIK